MKTKYLLHLIGLVLINGLLFGQSVPLTKCPKHYMLKSGNDPQDSLSIIFNNPDFAGAQIKYTWRNLEPAKDIYDFSLICSDLNFLKSDGKHLIAQIQIKAFNGDPSNLPDYILNDSIYAGGEVSYNNTRTPKRWNLGIITRLGQLYTALADSFNGESYFDGITLTESAGGPDCDTSGDYTPEGLRDGIMQDMNNARNAFDSSKIIIQYLNFFHCIGGQTELAYLVAIADHGDSINVGFGGPDIRIGEQKPVYSFQPNYDGRIPLGNAVQFGDYTYINPYSGDTVTAEEIIYFAADTLKLDYIFWLKRQPFFNNDVVPTLVNHRTDCATGIKGNLMNDNVSIFPNPGNGVFYISLQNAAAKSNLEIYNILGKRIYETFYFKQQTSNKIDLSLQPKGIYFVKIYDSEKIYTEKIVIQ